MDTSKEYIKMCEKVDLDWPGKIGDYCSTDGKTIAVITNAEWHQDRSSGYWEGRLSVNGNKEIIPADDVIPVYRQDQLQEMVREQHTNYYFARRFSNFVSSDSSYERYSFEQLWLVFVMKEKYNKTWNGEDWVENAEQG